MSFTYKEKFKVIDEALEKQRYKWRLNARKDIDYDDVKQIIRFHIWSKWDQWNQSRPIEPWLKKIIDNQIKNCLRNYYSSLVRPCLKCDASEGDGLCRIYTKQCSACPLFSKWEKSKKSAYDINMPLNIEKHLGELESGHCIEINYEDKIKDVHLIAKRILTQREYRVYDLLYVKNKADEEAAKELKYKPTNQNKKGKRYKQLENYKKSIIKKIRAAVKDKISFYDEEVRT